MSQKVHLIDAFPVFLEILSFSVFISVKCDFSDSCWGTYYDQLSSFQLKGAFSFYGQSCVSIVIGADEKVPANCLFFSALHQESWV